MIRLMEKIRLVVAIAEILMITFIIQGNAAKGQTFESSCSSYTVHKASSRQWITTWNESLNLCLLNNSQLVSIEDENELNFLVEKLQPRRYPRIEYFIGLKKICGKWTWISRNNSIEVTPYKDPWASARFPDGTDTHCAKMFYKKSTTKFVYDDTHCNKYRGVHVGYICEKHVDCHNEKASTEIPQSTRLSRTKTLPSTLAIQSTSSTQQQTTELLTESKQSKTTRAPTDKEQNCSGYFTSEELMISVFVEGAFLVIAAIIIGILLFKLRVKANSHQSKYGTSITAKSNRDQLQDTRENASLVNPANAARQLGMSVETGDSRSGHTLQMTAKPCIIEGGYAVPNLRTSTSEGGSYAHLIPSKQEHRINADCSETPTYVNQTAMRHEYVNVYA